jgi:hypothetical protein
VSDPENSFREGEAFSAIFSFIFSIKRYFVSFSSYSTASVAFFLASLCFLRYFPKKPEGSYSYSFPSPAKSVESARAYVMSDEDLSPLAIMSF